MNTKELRIGNYVEVNGMVVEVTAINSEEDGHIEIKTSLGKVVEVKSSVAKPIPLTGELLGKCCQFDEEGRYIIGIDEHRHFLRVQDGYVVLLNRRNEDMIHFWDVQSLHQLQNLFFALKGEEITVNL